MDKRVRDIAGRRLEVENRRFLRAREIERIKREEVERELRELRCRVWETGWAK